MRPGGRRGQVIYFVVAVVLIIIIGSSLPGLFPKIPIIMFLVFTILVNLMFFVPAVIADSRYPHTCELKNKSIFCR